MNNASVRFPFGWLNLLPFPCAEPEEYSSGKRPTLRRRVTSFLKLALTMTLCLFAGTEETVSDDWPMWRFDARRSAAAPTNHLPEQLQPLWTINFNRRKQAWDDPLNLDLMTYDRIFEPIVMNGRMFVSFNDRDKVVAFDTDSGRELWSAYADGPIRLPPVAAHDRVYFTSDDGFLYCVSATTGDLIWKFSGAPNSQQAIGNRRIISAWPARGGAVVREGTVYFAASIWPFMGTYIYALDAESGAVKWVNDSTGSQYIRQPHSAPSFAGVAPQGALVATQNTLLVPGGRSVPAAFYINNGQLKYFEINAGGKGTGGSFVSADRTNFYVHTRHKGTRAFKLQTGVKTAFMPSEPVLHNDRVYSVETRDGHPTVCAYGLDEKQIWQVAADGSGDLILAGDYLIAAGAEQLSLIPWNAKSPEVSRVVPVDRRFERLLVADNKIFGVTADGSMTAFGSGQPSRATTPNSAKIPAPSATPRAIAQQILQTGDAQGYALWYGACDSPLANAMFHASPFVELAVIDSSAAAVDRLRPLLDSAGLYGKITAHASPPLEFQPPGNIANMVFVDQTALSDRSPRTIPKLYESVRPFGGVLYLLCAAQERDRIRKEVSALSLEQAEIEVFEHGVMVRRVGPLPGAADWTHQYGDVANTIKSNDRRVRLPLGVLWFGGSSNMDVLPRHGHGPPEQVIGGRLFIQGMNSLSCRDVYTGRVIWKRDFENLGTFDVYYDSTYDNTPLNPKYNQVHIPGANGRGTNFVATEDRVYILEGSVCHVLNPDTGALLTDIRMPNAAEGEEWGYIGVYKNVLLGGQGFADFHRRRNVTLDTDKDLKSSRAGFGTKSFDRAASRGLTAFDRYSGKVLWTLKASHSFWHNGIIAGGDKVYCLDRNPPQLEEVMRRRGLENPGTYRIVAVDFRSGEQAWERTKNIFGTWLSYSSEHNLLLQAGASGSDRLAGEVAAGMGVYSAADGDIVWENESLKYTGPCILHNDLIITNTNSYSESAGAFYLKTGKPKLIPNPLTGELQPWRISRAYGCNNIIASENLLTFRSGAAGYYDLETNAGTGNLGGFKSGCTSNLVVAGGVLNAPDYTRTCSCAYQNQTSLALVHMPSIETWTVSSAASFKTNRDRIESLGLNLGAPGDRRDATGTLWLEYPVVAGPSPPLSIRTNSDARYFQQHSSSLPDTDLSWVLASGAENLTDLRIGINLQRSDLKSGIPIGHEADDAEENEQGAVNLSSSDLELIHDDGRQIVGLRFNNIPLDEDSRITKAYIQLTCDEISDEDTTLLITAEDTGNAARFSSEQHDLSSRTTLAREIGWNVKPWPTKGKADSIHRTPDLKKLIQAIVSREDWTPGNSIVFLFTGTGKRVAGAWKNGNRNAARLVVESDTTAVIPSSGPPDTFDIRLLFSNPTPDSPRTFDVMLQGEPTWKNVTVGSGKHAVAVRERFNVPIGDELKIRLVPKTGQPVLSGLHLSRSRTIEATPSP